MLRFSYGAPPGTGHRTGHCQTTNAPPPRRAGGRGQWVRQGRKSVLLRGCTSNGDRDRPTPARGCVGLPVRQRRCHHDSTRAYGSSTAPYRLISIRHRSRWAGSQPWCRPIRFDGSRGRLPGCTASDRGGSFGS